MILKSKRMIVLNDGTKGYTLKPGVNTLADEAWDKLKDLGMAKHLLAAGELEVAGAAPKPAPKPKPKAKPKAKAKAEEKPAEAPKKNEPSGDESKEPSKDPAGPVTGGAEVVVDDDPTKFIDTKDAPK